MEIIKHKEIEILGDGCDVLLSKKGNIFRLFQNNLAIPYS